MGPKQKIEAVLFAVGKEVTISRLAQLCGLEESVVEQELGALAEAYQQTDHAFKIERRLLGWKMTVKDTYLPLVTQLVTETELDRPLMETLAVVAWKYPVVQSEIIKLRHAAAYEHLQRLEEMGFVVKEKFGRTYKIRLTKTFFEYFDLPSEEAKQAFLRHIPLEVRQVAEEVEKVAAEEPVPAMREAPAEGVPVPQKSPQHL